MYSTVSGTGQAPSGTAILILTFHFERGGAFVAEGARFLNSNTAPKGRRSTGGGEAPAWAEGIPSPKRATEELGWSAAPSGLDLCCRMSGGCASLAPGCVLSHLRCYGTKTRIQRRNSARNRHASPPKAKMRIVATGKSGGSRSGWKDRAPCRRRKGRSSIPGCRLSPSRFEDCPRQ